VVRREPAFNMPSFLLMLAAIHRYVSASMYASPDKRIAAVEKA